MREPDRRRPMHVRASRPVRPGGWALVLVPTLVAVLVAGCAGASAAAASPVATAAVNLPASYRFDPVAIIVSAGTTVTWTNEDNFTHSVQLLDGGLPSTPQVITPGHAATFTFTTPGLFHYQCSFHPQDMQGSVLVTAP